MKRKVINRKHFSFWSLKNWTFSVLSPKACPYVMALSLFVTVGGKKIPLRGGATQGEIFDRWLGGFYHRT